MTNQEIVTAGRDKMDATDAELAIARRVAAQTEQTAVGTAAQLKKQTEQMQNVASDLNEIEFTMKRASRVITDITRGLATDKCARPSTLEFEGSLTPRGLLRCPSQTALCGLRGVALTCGSTSSRLSGRAARLSHPASRCKAQQERGRAGCAAMAALPAPAP